MTENKVKNAWYKRWWAITLFIFVGLIIIGGLFGGNNNTSTSSNSNLNVQQNTQDQVTAPKDEVKTYGLGDSIQAGDFKWKITKVSTTKEIGQDIMGSFFGEKADGVFVILDVEVENTANSAKYLMDSYLKLVDNQNREFSPNSAAVIYLKPEGSALMFEQVNPGIIKKGKIVFDVPESVKNFNLKITSSLFESNIYNVKITI